MKKYYLPVLFSLFLVILAASCKKENDDFEPTAIESYAPLQAGKYVDYRLDSTVFTSFGTQQEVHSYDVRFMVDAQISDNLGRPAWRIFRSIKPVGSGTYVPDATFTAINTGTGYEFIENNMRFIKLLQPIRNEYSWKGNSFIDTYSVFSTVKYLDNWDYVYTDVHTPKTYNTLNFDSTITVLQRDDSLGLPLTPQTQYAEKNFSKEVYAAGVGLVFRDFLHYEFQRVSNTYSGYGIRLTVTGFN